MKILFVMDSPGAGGAERSTADLWYFLRDEDIQFDIIFLNNCSPGIGEEIKAAGFNTYYLDGLSFIQQSRSIVKKIKELNPDIVHSILFKSNLRTRFARLQYRFVHIESLVNCTYDVIRLKDPNVGKVAFYCYKLLDKRTSFLVDHYHSITKAVKDHYVNELMIDPAKISVIYRGRNPTTSRMVDRVSIGFSADDFLIINTGRHEFQKGQIFLIQAVKELIGQGYHNIKLLILGRDGNATKSIKEFTEENSLQQHITFGGFRSDVTEILPAGDLFAFPSLYEGLGGALIEAQAAGLPIVCNSLPVFKEVVEEGENAKLFTSENIQSIVDAILFFYKNHEVKTQFGRKSLENFEAKFNMDKVNSEMVSLYARLRNGQ